MFIAHNGIDVYQSPYLERSELRFFKKPKSKKKRIINKWRKNKSNWKMFFWEEAIYIEGERKMFVGAKTYAKLINEISNEPKIKS